MRFSQSPPFRHESLGVGGDAPRLFSGPGPTESTAPSLPSISRAVGTTRSSAQHLNAANETFRMHLLYALEICIWVSECQAGFMLWPQNFVLCKRALTLHSKKPNSNGEAPFSLKILDRLEWAQKKAAFKEQHTARTPAVFRNTRRSMYISLVK